METTTEETEEKTAIAVVDATASLAVTEDDWDYGDEYIEDVDPADINTPMLTILQHNSPQVADELGKPGDLWDTVAEEAIPALQSKGAEGVLLVPVCHTRDYREWGPRDDGGGLEGVYTPEDPVVLTAKEKTPFGKIELDNGNSLVETVMLYCLVVDNEYNYIGAAIVPFKSTQLKVFKNFMTNVHSFRLPKNPKTGRRGKAPLFAHCIRMQTVMQQKDANRWFNFVITPAKDGENVKSAMKASLVSRRSEVFHAAVKLAEMQQRGEVKYDQNAGGEAASSSSEDSEDIPF